MFVDWSNYYNSQTRKLRREYSFTVKIHRRNTKIKNKKKTQTIHPQSIEMRNSANDEPNHAE